MPIKPEDESGGRVWPRPEIVVPNPDPSDVTLRYIDNEVDNLEKRLGARIDGMEKAVQVFHDDLTRVPTLLDRSIAGLRELLEARMGGTDALFLTLKERVEGKNGGLDDEIKHLRELMESQIKNVGVDIEKISSVTQERFTRIDTQFVERDKRLEQLSLADKTAVAAALQAAKEAVGAQNTSNSIAIAKSESSTVESIKQLQALFATANSALNDKVNDLKGRFDRGEGRTSISEPGTSDEIQKLRSAILNLATSRDAAVGHSAGISQFTGLMIALGGLAIAAVTMAAKFF